MVRSSIFPLNFYENLFSTDTNRESVMKQLKQLAKDPMIQEIIYVSSTSLYHSLKNWDDVTDPKKEEQILHSFCKYLIRMSTRPTPFGLVSGVTYGLFDEKPSKLHLDSYEYHLKRARPDMDWLLSIVQKLENDPAVLRQLKVKTNSIIFEAGNRLNVPYKSNCGQQDISNNALNMETISIRSTKVTDIILELAKENVQVADIIETLQKEFPEVEREKIESVILQLVQNEYIITELRPPLMTTTPFEYVLEKIYHLKGIEELQEQLQQIHQLIRRYNEVEIGKGLDLIQKTIKVMKQVSNKKHPIQVDVRLSNPPITLHNEVKEECRKISEVLWKVSTGQTGLSHINDYREDFIEKYGTYREVPVLELLDEDHGLGAPATYNFPKSSRKPPQSDNFQTKGTRTYFITKIIRCIQNEQQQDYVNRSMISNNYHMMWMRNIHQIPWKYTAPSLQRTKKKSIKVILNLLSVLTLVLMELEKHLEDLSTSIKKLIFEMNMKKFINVKQQMKILFLQS